MAVSRHLGFYQTANSIIRSADPENPGLEPNNMQWIGCTVCEIFAFKLYCDLETGVWGHSRSSKVALFYRANTTLYSSSIVFIIYYRFRDKAPCWSKIANPLYSAPPLRVKLSDVRSSPWWQKICQLYAAALGDKKSRDGEGISMIRSAVLIQNTRVTDGQTDRQNCRRGIYVNTAARKKERERIGKVECRRNLVWNYIRITKRTL